MRSIHVRLLPGGLFDETNIAFQMLARLGEVVGRPEGATVQPPGEAADDANREPTIQRAIKTSSQNVSI
jgi:hypothetical protein